MVNLLELRDISSANEARNNEPIFTDINLVVTAGDVVALQGKSGSGKTTLLKCIAHLNVYDGLVLYRGSTPMTYGIPAYRKKVAYVPQRSPLLPGTPRDFVNTVLSLSARSDRSMSTFQHIIDLGAAWSLDRNLWDREWTNLSGGESQRIALSIALALNTAEVLLLDEPTSALDPELVLLVEQSLLKDLRSDNTALKAIVWITHSDEQASRVGTRFIQVSGGNCHEQSLPPV
ncbi:P-loop containing nucleoside triphosphate hydrolase protein [Guyanagaster necrorhizus]|uniref:P-loop containing nucleoside triphosphate hydrolase protein n=1 Tax=Guyanagaster necrorhizus TaxID=856835 RepID=A0A9P7W5E8_9AGAR|nr:P-loop containing nucleoside triphosphate hydrolase protein [Guyanagaster necrorhizus MCA 3950]KAG7452468.1 P-loop containing nucleoside triphosphate hydrolase protein [Guyanagaster necrorhizus MCA 3950]